MENPFKPADKVLTKIKGAETEVTVRLTFNKEVQVRCADGQLRWRTDKTVWFPSVLATAESASEQAPSAPTGTEMQTAADTNDPAEEPAPSAAEVNTEPQAAPPAPAAEQSQEPAPAPHQVRGKRKKRK